MYLEQQMEAKALKIDYEDYFNRKHFYSFLVQGVVDASGL